jgi:hypothetical protein
MVAGGLPSIDVKDLACHKPRAIKVEHRTDNVGYVAHLAHWMERCQCLMRFGRMHRRLDDSR